MNFLRMLYKKLFGCKHELKVEIVYDTFAYKLKCTQCNKEYYFDASINTYTEITEELNKAIEKNYDVKVCTAKSKILLNQSPQEIMNKLKSIN